MGIFKVNKYNDLQKEVIKTGNKEKKILESYICEKCGIRYEICDCVNNGEITE